MYDKYHYRRFNGKLYLLYKAFKHKTSKGVNRYRNSAELEVKEHWRHRQGYSARIAQVPKEQVYFGRKWGVYVRDTIRPPKGQHWGHDSVYPGPGNERPQGYLDELWEKKHKRERATAPKRRPARATTGRKHRRAPEKRVRTFGITRYYLYKAYRNKRDAQAKVAEMHRTDFRARLVKAGPRRYEVWWNVHPDDRKRYARRF